MSSEAWAIISKYVPGRHSNGMQQRIALLTHALSKRYSVHLHIVAGRTRIQGRPDPELLAAFDERTHWVEAGMPDPSPEWREKFDFGATEYFTTKEVPVHPLRLLPGELRLGHFSGILVFMPLMVEPAQYPAEWLKAYDWSEVISVRAASFRALAATATEVRGRTVEARFWAAWERRSLSGFDLVAVCSSNEAALARSVVDSGLNPVIWPNPCWAATGAPILCGERTQRVLLFVGELSYEPNQDAVRWLLEEILPTLRERGVDLPLRVVGFSPPDWMCDEAGRGGLEMVVGAEDLRGQYREAAVAVVPLRYGGGTRLKIPEAFAHRVPVVSTSKGAEGLAVESGRELLLADTAPGFADACRKTIAGGPAVEEQLERALSWVAQTNHPDRLADRILGDIDRAMHLKRTGAPT